MDDLVIIFQIYLLRLFSLNSTVFFRLSLVCKKALNATFSLDAVRMTFIIVSGMVAGKYIPLGKPVYLAFFPIILALRVNSSDMLIMVKILLPTVMSAVGAVFISELFSEHPFVIWTIALFFFDWQRRKADTSAKVAGILTPIFIWILITVSAQLSIKSPLFLNLREMIFCVMITLGITWIGFRLFPKKIPLSSTPKISAIPITVSYKQRAISLFLIGIGCAFLMITQMTSALFCLVPVIALATQTSRQGYFSGLKRRLLTQTSGCALSVFFTFLLAGQQNIAAYYILCLGLLVYILCYAVVNSLGEIKEVNLDALMATLFPIQLYICQSGISLKGAYLRGWQLTVTLLLMLIIYYFSERKLVDIK